LLTCQVIFNLGSFFHIGKLTKKKKKVDKIGWPKKFVSKIIDFPLPAYKREGEMVRYLYLLH